MTAKYVHRLAFSRRAGGRSWSVSQETPWPRNLKRGNRTPTTPNGRVAFANGETPSWLPFGTPEPSSASARSVNRGGAPTIRASRGT